MFHSVPGVPRVKMERLAGLYLIRRGWPFGYPKKTGYEIPGISSAL
jgi:hypothetical protein